jgi:hypothetical protein
MDTLFQTFSQVQHHSGEYGGTGLGLVIMAKLVHAMNGAVSVQSQSGVGSVFSFTIVAQVQQEPTPATADSAALSSQQQQQQQMQMQRINPTVSTTHAPAAVAPTARSTSTRPSSHHISTPRSTSVSDKQASLLAAATVPLGPAASMSAPRLGPSGSSEGVDSQASGGAHVRGRSIPHVASVGSSSNSSPLLDAHGLTSSERAQFDGTSLLYIGRRHEAADTWLNLLAHFGCNINVYASAEEAALWWPKAHAAAAPDAASSPSPSSQPGSPLPPSAVSVVNSRTLVLVDLDSKGISEECVLEALEGAAAALPHTQPLRLLFLFSALHLRPMTRSDSQSLALSACSSPVLSQRTLASPSAAPSVMLAAAASSPASPIDRLQQMSMAHTSAGGESVSASAVADSYNHSRSHSTSSSVRPTPTGSPHMHPVAVASLLRTLQKPFRMQQLLKDLLQLLGEEVAADGRSTTSNGLITAAAGSMLSVAADGTLDAARKSASPGGVRSHRRMVMSSGGGLAAPSVFEGSGRNSSILPPVPSGRTKLVPIAQDYPLRILLAEDNLSTCNHCCAAMRVQLSVPI